MKTNNGKARISMIGGKLNKRITLWRGKVKVIVANIKVIVANIKVIVANIKVIVANIKGGSNFNPNTLKDSSKEGIIKGITILLTVRIE